MSAGWSYDAIAEVYATDMGQSMPFDDAGWYRALCARECGPDARILELGCGTGRILLQLLRAGLNVVGADRSLPMLLQLRSEARIHALTPALMQMDIEALALRGAFNVILLPYSLITYVTDHDSALALLRQLALRLAPEGKLVLDAFVPQPVLSFTDFRRDYRRAHGAAFLERHKRITANPDGTNSIERRYSLRSQSDAIIEQFETHETIRPYTVQTLHELGAAAGLALAQTVFDYADSRREKRARFATIVLAKK